MTHDAAGRHRKERRDRRQRRRWLLGLLPRRKHLRDTWLHRVLGERLFAHELWKPERRAVAGGLALGVFVALTPTLGVQMVLAALLAIFLRVNLPLAIGACWITNPASASVIYPLLYRLGLALSGPLPLEAIDGQAGPLHAVLIRARPLWVGCLVAGVFAAAVVYGAVMVAWRWIAVHVEPILHHHRGAQPPANVPADDPPPSFAAAPPEPAPAVSVRVAGEPERLPSEPAPRGAAEADEPEREPARPAAAG